MSARTAGGRHGFTVLEALTAMVVVATVVRMGFPEIHAFLKRTQAGDIVQAVETVRAAAERFRAEKGTWPADARTGEFPPDLAPYLPEEFRFEGAGYRLDWERWALPDGLPGAPEVHGLVGISVVTADVGLGRAVTRLLAGSTSHWRLDDSWTLIFARIP